MENAPQDMLNAFLTTMLKNFAPTLRKVDWFFIVFLQNFSQKKSSEQVQCSLDNPARTILFKILLFFSQIPEKILFSRNFLEKDFMTRLLPF